MSIFSIFKKKTVIDYKSLRIDLSKFGCGNSVLGDVPDPRDFFYDTLNKKDIFKDDRHGFEIGAKDGKLDYIYLEIQRFPGWFENDGFRIEIDREKTPDEIVAVFGEPYWVDDDTDNDEIILFYEDGRVELQFEFFGKKLTIITLMLDPTLSDSGQRASYGVTKSWPPG